MTDDAARLPAATASRSKLPSTRLETKRLDSATSVWRRQRDARNGERPLPTRLLDPNPTRSYSILFGWHIPKPKPKLHCTLHCVPVIRKSASVTHCIVLVYSNLKDFLMLRFRLVSRLRSCHVNKCKCTRTVIVNKVI